MRRGIWSCVLLVGLAGLGACSADPDRSAGDRAITKSHRSDEPPASRAVEAFISGQVDRQANADALYVDRSLAEMLPNQFVSVDGRPEVAAAQGVVIGEVNSVRPGQAYDLPAVDADGGVPVAFDSPSAAWRVVVVTVAADHLLRRRGDRTTDTQQVIELGMVMYGENYREQMQGIKDLRSVVVVLDAAHTYDFEPGLAGVARGGALFGDIDSAGVVGFPALGRGSAAYVGKLDTVPEVIAAAMKPDAHRTVRTTGERTAYAE